MEWVLVLLIVTNSGDVTSAKSEKAMTHERCEAIGLSQVVRLREDNHSADYYCLSTAGTKAPRKPVKNT